jgi:Flp pilus assembly protein TadG
MKITKTNQNKQKGVALVEFALIAPIFFLLLFATIEFGLFYFTQVNLSVGVSSAIREVKIGNIQTNFNPVLARSKFKEKVCDYSGKPIGLVDCDKLEIDAYRAFSFDKVIPKGGKFFDTGSSGQAVAISVVYPYTFHTPIVSNVMTGWGDKIIITKIFQNEHF